MLFIPVMLFQVMIKIIKLSKLIEQSPQYKEGNHGVPAPMCVVLQRYMLN